MDSDFHLAVRPHLSAMSGLGFQSNGRGRVRRSVPILRKSMIVLLTAAALSGGLTADAFARGGGPPLSYRVESIDRLRAAALA
jgi:hypothetical protein